MSRLTDAIAWSGSDVTLSLFVAFPSQEVVTLTPPGDVAEPRLIRDYDLEDLDGHLSGRSCREYDLTYDVAPLDLEAVVRSWIASAMLAGADFAWFGFEGSFDFKHILTSDLADQVFAVGSPDATHLALDDDYREGPAGRTSYAC